MHFAIGLEPDGIADTELDERIAGVCGREPRVESAMPADKLMEKTQSDFNSLDNMKQGTMNGANNPCIRAKMD